MCKCIYTESSVLPHDEFSGDYFRYDYEGDQLKMYNGRTCTYNDCGQPSNYTEKSADGGLCG